MATIRILLGIFCLATFGRGTEYGGGVLTRNTLVAIAISQIGVREATGNNDGVQVEAFLKVTHLPKYMAAERVMEYTVNGDTLEPLASLPIGLGNYLVN